jgi:hypothetical protein
MTARPDVKLLPQKLKKIRFMLWREALKRATLLDGLFIIKLDKISDTQDAHWDGQFPKY